MNTSNLETFKLPKKASKFHRRKFKAFFKKLGLESLFPKFDKTPHFWTLMSIDIIVFDFIQDDFEMPPHLLEAMEEFFGYYAHNISYQIPDRDISFTLYEGLELARRFRHSTRACFEEGTKVRRQCEVWIEHLWQTEVLDLAFERILNGLMMITTMYSSCDDWIYSSEIDVHEHPSNPIKLRYKVTIPRKRAEVYNRTGRNLRRYYLLEYGDGDGQFNHRMCSFDGKIYPVYLQAHALKRLQERVYITQEQVHFHILLHTNYDDVFVYKGSHLVPFYVDSNFKHKIGYFAGEFHDDRLLINTFLFLSQDGTPEGDKLNELLQVKKMEKAWLQLDELRYFTNSDLRDDEELVPLLKECQLDHLFKYQVTGPGMDFTMNADFIKDTLQLESKKLPETKTLKPELQEVSESGVNDDQPTEADLALRELLKDSQEEDLGKAIEEAMKNNPDMELVKKVLVGLNDEMSRRVKELQEEQLKETLGLGLNDVMKSAVKSLE